MEQRQQNTTCVMEEFQKSKQTKKCNICPSCNGKIMGVWVCLFVTLQSRLTVLSSNVQIPYKKVFVIHKSQSTGRVLLLDGLCSGLLLQKPIDCRTNIISVSKKKEMQGGICWILGITTVGSLWVAQLYANKNFN